MTSNCKNKTLGGHCHGQTHLSVCMEEKNELLGFNYLLCRLIVVQPCKLEADKINSCTKWEGHMWLLYESLRNLGNLIYNNVQIINYPNFFVCKNTSL